VRQHIGGIAAITLLLTGTAVTFLTRPGGGTAQPRTPQAAASAAASELAAMHAGRYADAWHRLTPADQSAIPLAQWTAYYRQCGAHLASYQVDGAALTGPATAIAVAQITYAGGGMPPVPGTIQMNLDYDSTAWRYDAPPGLWREGPVTQMLDQARLEGICQS